MDWVNVIIGNENPDKAVQVSIAEGDHVVEGLAETASGPPCGNSILPRA